MIFMHCVWSTKNRFPFLDSPQLRRQVWGHIKENAIAKKINLDIISGYSDHCHCLIALGSDEKLSRIMMLIKGESAHWINKSKLCKTTFAWQDHYYFFKVDELSIELVRNYIKNQETHHGKVNFNEEIDSLISDFERSGLKPL